MCEKLKTDEKVKLWVLSHHVWTKKIVNGMCGSWRRLYLEKMIICGKILFWNFLFFSELFFFCEKNVSVKKNTENIQSG